MHLFCFRKKLSFQKKLKAVHSVDFFPNEFSLSYSSLKLVFLDEVSKGKITYKSCLNLYIFKKNIMKNSFYICCATNCISKVNHPKNLR